MFKARRLAISVGNQIHSLHTWNIQHDTLYTKQSRVGQASSQRTVSSFKATDEQFSRVIVHFNQWRRSTFGCPTVGQPAAGSHAVGNPVGSPLPTQQRYNYRRFSAR